MRFKNIDPKALQVKPVELFAKDWMLLTSGSLEKHNAMTVGWGGLGVLWGLPAATCYVRPDRFTYSFLNESDTFTLCAFDERYREQLLVYGTKSGRDTDKDAVCGFTPVGAESGAVYYAEARLALVCRKIYTHDFDPARFLDARVEKIYEKAPPHRMYVGEILEVLIKED